MDSPDNILALRVPRPEILEEMLNQAPTFEAEELLTRLDRLARELSSNPEAKVEHIRFFYDAGSIGGVGGDLASIWQRLCQARSLAHRRMARATRWDGVSALRYGTLAFVAALASPSPSINGSRCRAG